MLSVEQRNEIETRGFTYVRALIARDEAAEIERRVWGYLAKRGIDRSDRSTWPRGGLVSHLQGLRHAKVFAPFSNAQVFAIVDQLLGAGTWTRPRLEPQALLSFPEAGPWDVAHRIWHFDFPARGSIDRHDAVRLLGFAAAVETHGGGTLLIEGSHALVRQLVARAASGDAGQSSDVRRKLVRRSRWFAALTSDTFEGDRVQHFMVDGDEIDGVRVRVVEATGDGGDALLMHPWMMHTTAKNCSERPRMMLSQTYLRDDNAFYAAGTRDDAPREVEERA